MEIKISEELNAIISYSKQEAMRTGNYTIKPDHLYLGILRQRTNEAYDILRGLDVDTDALKRHIDERIFTAETISYSETDNITFSRNTQNILSFTILEATRANSRIAGAGHLLLALGMDSRSFGTNYLRNNDVDYARLSDYIRRRPMPEEEIAGEEYESGPRTGEEAHRSGEEPGKKARESVLAEFGRDITEAARSGQLDPVVGREAEMERVLQILGRRRKNNPMLVGDPGVGKTSIVEGIAMKIASGDVPADLLGKRILTLDIASVVAGTKYRGEFEKRIKAIIRELSENPDTIIFMDEFHTVVGAGGAEGSLDAANILKPALARGEIHCIGATTFEEFSKIVEKDKALDRRFQKVTVSATGPGQTVSILEELRPRYEAHHGVSYSSEAVEACVSMSERYITDRCLPDKAIDILDEAGSMVHLRSAVMRNALRHAGENAGVNAGERSRENAGRPEDDEYCPYQDPPRQAVAGRQNTPGHESSGIPQVTSDDIAAVVSKMTGIPAGHVMESESSRLLNMDAVLKAKIIGQDDAVDTVVRAIRRNRAGLRDPHRPIGSFLFVGPTGVGKTLLAKALAECLFDSEDNLVRIDMSEYMEKFNVSRLIGAPPGYVGYNEGGQLSEKVRRKPYCVVLLDEIEKANPDIYNLLLQIMDEGRLTDSSGRLVDFRNTILIMTSNAGSRETDEYGRGLGFTTAVSNAAAARKAIVEKTVKKIFPPEFLGRVDEQIFFNPLGREDMGKIIDIELGGISSRLAAHGIILCITPEAKSLTVEYGFNPKFGARPLKNAIRKYIEDPVSEHILTHGLLVDRTSRGTVITVGITPDGRSTCVLPRPGSEASRKSPAEDAVRKSLEKLYVDNFEPHLVDHVDESPK